VKKNGEIDYQAASPDELALVHAAQELGYMMVDRQAGTITIKSWPRGSEGEPVFEVYEIRRD
jgi:phospholipid-translocating ATPase